MNAISEWVTNIILFILLAMVIELLLPKSSFQKYAKMVIGLLLIVMILSPMLKLLTIDPEKILERITESSANEQLNFEINTERKKIEIQAQQHAYILEQMAVHMENEAEEELINKFGYEIEHIELFLTDHAGKTEHPEEWVEKVSVAIKRAVDDDDVTTAVKPISVVKIDTSNSSSSQPAEEVAVAIEPVQHELSQIWMLPEEKIELIEEGRDLNGR